MNSNAMRSKRKLLLGTVFSLCVALVFFVSPPPHNLPLHSWHFLGIFLAVIMAFILEPFPPSLVGVIGVLSVAYLELIPQCGISTVKWIFSGLTHPSIWIIVSIFIFSRGYQRSGLGKRLSLILIKYLGKSSLGLGYAIAIADLVLAPFLPSNTARSGGVLYPIVINIPTLFHSSAHHKRRKIGAYMVWVCVVSMCISSSMFFTALAPHLLMISSLLDQISISISWNIWITLSLYCLLPLFFISPFLIYLFYPPTSKVLPEASQWAEEELIRMGTMSRKELWMSAFAVLTLVVWFFSKTIGIDVVILVLGIVGLMVLCGVISWKDVFKNTSAWNIFVWFVTLLTLSSGLHHLKITDWVGGTLEDMLIALSPHMVMVTLLVCFFVLHYFFASLIAHVSVLLPLFVVIASKFLVAEHLQFFVVLLACSIGLMGVLTPYGTGASPIWYSSGYITPKEWWGLGALFGGIFLSVLILTIFIFV